MNNLWRRRRYIFGSGGGGDFAAGGGGGGGSPFSNQYSSFFVGASPSNATGSYGITSSLSGFPIDSPAGFSLSLWVYASGTGVNTWNGGTSMTIASVGNQGSGGGSRLLSWALKTRDSNGTTLEFAFATSPDQFNTFYRFTAPDVFTWNHIFVVYNPNGFDNNDRAKAWVNGVAQLTSSGFSGFIPTGTLSSSTWPLSIGAQPTGRFGAQAIDEICVYNSALTGTHATALYNAGTPTDPRTITGSTNLVHYWRMGDGDTFPNIQDQITSFAGISPMDLGMRSGDPAHFTASVPPLGSIGW